jgi:hypothetical protein
MHFTVILRDEPFWIVLRVLWHVVANQALMRWCSVIHQLCFHHFAHSVAW